MFDFWWESVEVSINACSGHPRASLWGCLVEPPLKGTFEECTLYLHAHSRGSCAIGSADLCVNGKDQLAPVSRTWFLHTLPVYIVCLCLSLPVSPGV